MQVWVSTIKLGRLRHMSPRNILRTYRGRKYEKCPADTFSFEGIPEYCIDCLEGSYALPGSSACITCPEGQALNLSDRMCGICPPGKLYDSYDARCVPCSLDQYEPESGNNNCVKCPYGYAANMNRTACEETWIKKFYLLEY